MGSKFCSSAVVSEMGRISLGLLLSWVALAWRVTESRRIVRYCKKDGRTCSRPVERVYNRHLLPKLPCCCHSSAEHGCCDFSKVKQEGLFAFESQQPVEPAEVIAARLFPESLRFWARQVQSLQLWPEMPLWTPVRAGPSTHHVTITLA